MSLPRQGAFGALLAMAMTAPLATGMVVDHTGNFASAFVIAAIIAVVGILAYVLVVRRIEPIDWRAPAEAELLPALPPQG